MGKSPEDSKSINGSGLRRAAKVVSFEEARKSSRARLGQRKEFNIARGALKEGALYDPNEVIADPDPIKQAKRPKLVKRSAKDDQKKAARPNVSKKTQPLSQSDQKALVQSQSRPTIAKTAKTTKISDAAQQADRPSASEKKSRMAVRVDSMREAREERRRAKTKVKADKKFDAMYGDDAKTKSIVGSRSSVKDSASLADDGGPHAAVYKGKMGALHKKSAKLQRKAKEHVSSMNGELTIPSIKLPFASSRRAWTAICAVVVCFMCAFMLYGPAQQYYVQMRETDRLQAEYLAVAQRSDNLQASIDSLQTDAGIEDKAHADLGYIKRGEKTGTVKGIDFDDSREFSTNVMPNSVPAPDTWYSPFFDVFFNYANIGSSKAETD